jgi:transposase-like protein
MNRNGLKENQMAAIVALLAGEGFASAARTAGVNISTLRNWRRQDKIFKEELRKQRDEIMSQTRSKISDSAIKSVKVLKELRDDPEGNEGVRYKCAAKLLDLSLQVCDIYELQNEIEDLKEKLGLDSE